MPKGLKIDELQAGTGALAEKGDTVQVLWRGTLNRGDSFGTGDTTFCAGGRDVIAGLARGVIGMRVGGVRRLRISPHLGYGDREIADIPPNAVLVFEVELVDVKKNPEVDL